MSPCNTYDLVESGNFAIIANIIQPNLHNMAKTVYQSNTTKVAGVIFFVLVCLSLLAPLWVFKDLLFPYVTSKAFYFRICLELALPFYVYLLLVRPELRPKWKRQYLNWLMLAF